MNQGDSNSKIEALRRRAVELGVSKAKIIDPARVYTAEWVRWKCQFGCGGYGRCLTCPPYAPPPSETRKMLDEYKTALLLWTQEPWPGLRKAVAELERTAFLDNFYKAFGMASGPCNLCDECSLEYPCKYPRLARPSLEACGIDVFRTAREAGFEINVVKDRSCTPNFFALLLIE